MLVIVPAATLSMAGPTAARAELDGPVYVIRITGEIDLGVAPYIDRVVADAEDAGAVAIVIVIDTPGGRLDAVLQMRDACSVRPCRCAATRPT